MKLKWRASDGKGCIDTPRRSPRNRDTRGYIEGVCAIFITLSSIYFFKMKFPLFSNLYPTVYILTYKITPCQVFDRGKFWDLTGQLWVGFQDFKMKLKLRSHSRENEI